MMKTIIVLPDIISYCMFLIDRSLNCLNMVFKIIIMTFAQFTTSSFERKQHFKKKFELLWENPKMPAY